jgi:glycosyltransferase involved in cell wall biosynthesis
MESAQRLNGMRAAIDMRIYGRRGIGRYNVQLHNCISTYGAGRLDPTFLGRRPDHAAGRWQPLWTKWYVTQEQLDLPLVVGRGRYEVVHLTANTAPVLQARWPRLVVTVHDVMYLKSTIGNWLSPSPRQLLGRAYRAGAFLTGTIRASRLIVDSQQTARDVRRLLGRHSPPIDVVYPAVDPAFSNAKDAGACERACEASGVQPGGFFIHAGAVDPRKNTKVVVEAFTLYAEQGGQADLVIYGLGPFMRERLLVSLSPRTRKRVHLLTWISDDSVVALTQSAVASVFVPSDEGFGYPMLEAMAAGTPVVASSIPVLREISAGHASWVEPRDRNALSDALLTFDAGGGRPRVVDEARARANSFSRKTMADGIVMSYERAVGDIP